MARHWGSSIGDVDGGFVRPAAQPLGRQIGGDAFGSSMTSPMNETTPMALAASAPSSQPHIPGGGFMQQWNSVMSAVCANPLTPRDEEEEPQGHGMLLMCQRLGGFGSNAGASSTLETAAEASPSLTEGGSCSSSAQPTWPDSGSCQLDVKEPCQPRPFRSQDVATAASSSSVFTVVEESRTSSANGSAEGLPIEDLGTGELLQALFSKAVSNEGAEALASEVPLLPLAAPPMVLAKDIIEDDPPAASPPPKISPSPSEAYSDGLSLSYSATDFGTFYSSISQTRRLSEKRLSTTTLGTELSQLPSPFQTATSNMAPFSQINPIVGQSCEYLDLRKQIRMALAQAAIDGRLKAELAETTTAKPTATAATAATTAITATTATTATTTTTTNNSKLFEDQSTSDTKHQQTTATTATTKTTATETKKTTATATATAAPNTATAATAATAAALYSTHNTQSQLCSWPT
eukprot:TRINITY_DN16006_c0_g3_i1.p1 TRINITY_DN16006_c0_g3~~TRINITY_DN16006_c0_g3_i1.p1  ORF type:complete len:503 (+),score=119.48 TRINITY_DN16006_c0_g3_i1:120-1511(+)